MLKNLISKYILNTIIGSLKGKKRWLVILVLLGAQIAQSAGVDVGSFVEDLGNLLNAEG